MLTYSLSQEFRRVEGKLFSLSYKYVDYFEL